MRTLPFNGLSACPECPQFEQITFIARPLFAIEVIQVANATRIGAGNQSDDIYRTAHENSRLFFHCFGVVDTKAQQMALVSRCIIQALLKLVGLLGGTKQKRPVGRLFATCLAEAVSVCIELPSRKTP